MHLSWRLGRLQIYANRSVAPLHGILKQDRSAG